MHLIILYFVNGPAANDADKQLIAELAERGYPVCYRNAQYVSEHEIPEKHDGVAGFVPLAYEGCTHYEDAIAEYEHNLALKQADLDSIVGSHGVGESAPEPVIAKPSPFTATAEAMKAEAPAPAPATKVKSKTKSEPKAAATAPVWTAN